MLDKADGRFSDARQFRMDDDRERLWRVIERIARLVRCEVRLGLAQGHPVLP